MGKVNSEVDIKTFSREVARGHNKEQREERQKELAKVKGARSENYLILTLPKKLQFVLRNFFQNITSSRNSSMANPGVRLRSDEEIMDCYNSQSGKSKAFFISASIFFKFFYKRINNFYSWKDK